jgi:hypothetical protein
MTICNYLYGFPIRSGKTSREYKIPALLESYIVICHCRTLVLQRKDDPTIQEISDSPDFVFHRGTALELPLVEWGF